VRKVDRPQTDLVGEVVARIVNAVAPDKVILFGSRARGEADQDSDLDVLIVAPSSLPRWQRTAPIYRLLAGMGVPKDILWWTPEEVEEWRGVRSHFINAVLREGQVVYERPA
jgi:predicted nucleotidyltransferase